MREFRNKYKTKDQQTSSSNQFDAYVDKLVKNGANSNGNETRSAREAYRKVIKDQHDRLKQLKVDQKESMHKLQYEQKQMMRRAQGRAQIDIEEVLHEEKVSRIARNVLSGITIEQRRRK